MKLYHVYCADYRAGRYEDPQCPSRWMGSGVYDMTLYSVDLWIVCVCVDKEEEIASTIESWAKTRDLQNFEILWSEMVDDDYGYGSPFVDEAYWCECVLGPQEEEEDNILRIYSKEGIKAIFKLRGSVHVI